MKADVKVVLYHVATSAKTTNHEMCPSGTWCQYKTDPDNYKHKNGLPSRVVQCIEPIFHDPADEKLLKKCLHGKAQNNNECLNKLIWNRCAKEYYAEKETLEQSVFSAVAYFTDGAISIIKLF